MRTLDPILQAAMTSGDFEPIIRVYWGSTLVDCIYYKHHNLELTVKFYSATSDVADYIKIERGAKINGVEYVITSSWYFFENANIEKDLFTVNATIFYDSRRYTSTINIDYQSMIETLCVDLDLLYTPTYKDPAAAWLSYQFLPDGKSLTSNTFRNSLLSQLRQKYLIFATDNDASGISSGNILFFSIGDIAALNHTITPSKLDTWNYKPAPARDFIWRDETGSIHGLPTTSQIHNLGYLESTDTPPAVGRSYSDIMVTIPVNLKYQTGDKARFINPTTHGPAFIECPIDVTEILDIKSTPAWRMEIIPLEFFSNTDGGALPSTIERVAAYTPLVSTGFDGNLTPAVNNLQALAQAVDDMAVGGAESDPVFVASEAHGFAAGSAAKLAAIEASADVTDAGNVGSSIHGVANKNPPIDADKVPIIDTAAGNVLKTSTWTNIKAFLKTYFDTLYNNYVHPNHSGDVTSAADGATTIGAKKVTVAMLADGTDGQLITWDADGHAAVVPTGTATHVLTSNGAGAAPTFQAPSGGTSIYPPGFRYGCALTNGTDATNDINIAVGNWIDSTNLVNIDLAGALVKQLDAVWAVGTNAGMRASGAAIANTTYHIFLIKRPDTGVVDIAADTSATGANITANTDAAYTKRRRIGSIIRLAGAIVPFVQDDKSFTLLVPSGYISAANPGTAAITHTCAVPVGIRVQALLSVVGRSAYEAHNPLGIFVSDLSITDSTTTQQICSIVVYSLDNTALQGGSVVTCFTNTSGQIRIRLQVSGATTYYYLNTLGWVDTYL